MHDGDQRAMGADRSHTVEATDRLIAHYKAAGYEFATIPAMMNGQQAKRLAKNSNN
jgi:peptidoglycan/xylan/chitin deacetylase (PgdA/CDA1 family)